VLAGSVWPSLNSPIQVKLDEPNDDGVDNNDDGVDDDSMTAYFLKL
jgi:hypothetical protein